MSLKGHQSLYFKNKTKIPLNIRPKDKNFKVVPFDFSKYLLLQFSCWILSFFFFFLALFSFVPNDDNFSFLYSVIDSFLKYFNVLLFFTFLFFFILIKLH